MKLLVVAMASTMVAPPPSPRETGLRVAGYTALGLGLGSLVGSFAANRVAGRAGSRYADGASPGAIGFPEDFYAPEYRRLERRSQRARLASLVLASTGVGLLVVSPVLFGLARREKTRRLALSVDAGRHRASFGLVGRF